MLSKTDILEHLSLDGDSSGSGSSRIVVRPKWVVDGGVTKELSIREYTSYFRSRIIANRIPIRVGCLLRVFKIERAFAKAKWDGQDDEVLDLRLLPDGYLLKPGESAAIATSEYVSLPDSIAGIVISRVGFHVSGLKVSTSFVDAGWKGILTLQVSNVSNRPVPIFLGQEVARLFLFKLETEERGADKQVQEGSHHFGDHWEKILEQHLSPFRRIGVNQQGKGPGFFRKSIMWIRSLSKFDATVAVIIASVIPVLGSLFIFTFQLFDRVQDIPSVSHVSIPIPANESEGSVMLPSFKGLGKTDAVVLIEPTGSPDVNAQVSEVFYEVDENALVRIVLRVESAVDRGRDFSVAVVVFQ